jgi:outer membrane protein OmpA-like peptidoglycan-associated protein
MPRSRHRANRPALPLSILIPTFLVGMAVSAPAFALRNIGHVEVTSEAGRITSLRQVPTTTVATVARGTILEVMDEEGDWYWILLDPDLSGVRRAGWIRARDVVERPDLAVAVAAATPRSEAPSLGDAELAAPPPSAVPAVEVQEITVPDAPDVEIVLNFAFDSAELSVAARGGLDAMVAQLSANQSASIEIEGHTDSAGPAPYNQALGLRRAEAVMRYLSEQHQIPLELMKTASFGEDAPAADNDTREGRALNRRVAIRF